MPSSATITSFYSFQANTKARASYVNTNFSNFRGHIIAIDPNTATSATTETYDLGSTEYRWRTGYFREIDFKSSTSTGQELLIIGDTSTTQNALLLKYAGNTRARIGGGNQYIDCDTVTSQFDFKAAGSTLASIKTEGIPRTYIAKPTFYSLALSTSISNITATITKLGQLSVTSSGRLTFVGFNINPYGGSTDTGYLIRTNNTSTPPPSARFYIYRDDTSGTLIGTYNVAPSISDTVGVYNGIGFVSQFQFIDNSITSGGHTYYLYAKGSSSVVIQDATSSGVVARYFQSVEII